MAAHAHGYGYVVYSMFNGSGLVTVPRALMDNLISQMEADYEWSFVLTVDSLTTPGQLHSVGAVFFFAQEHKHKFRVCVSDSQLDLLSVYDYKEFFESPYSRIYELEVVGIPSVILLEPALTEQEVLNHLRNYSETRFSIYDQMIKIKEHDES
jgi:hypothetical protein